MTVFAVDGPEMTLLLRRLRSLCVLLPQCEGAEMTVCGFGG